MKSIYVCVLAADILHKHMKQVGDVHSTLIVQFSLSPLCQLLLLITIETELEWTCIYMLNNYIPKL
jgi:hypothetical protein